MCKGNNLHLLYKALGQIFNTTKSGFLKKMEFRSSWEGGHFDLSLGILANCWVFLVCHQPPIHIWVQTRFQWFHGRLKRVLRGSGLDPSLYPWQQSKQHFVTTAYLVATIVHIHATIAYLRSYFVRAPGFMPSNSLIELPGGLGVVLWGTPLSKGVTLHKDTLNLYSRCEGVP